MSQDKRRALGRGLESLLPTNRPAAAPTPVGHEITMEIPLELLERNPYQTRDVMPEDRLEELAASIRASGVLQPVLVRPIDGGRYQLIAGERRWLASKRAGKSSIPAVVKHVSNQQALEMTIIENLQREDLNPMEHAAAFDRLAREFAMTQEQMSLRTGKERATIANYVRLLRLPEAVRLEIARGTVSFGHAKVLLALATPQMVEHVTGRIVRDGLSVRQTEEMVTEMLMPAEKPERPIKPVDPNVRQAEQELERTLGLRVRIKDKRGRGKIVIEYNSLEDFDRVVQALGK